MEKSNNKFDRLVGWKSVHGLVKEYEKREHLEVGAHKISLEDGLSIIIGCDMNDDVWDVDGCENKNHRKTKKSMNEPGLQILNCV